MLESSWLASAIAASGWLMYAILFVGTIFEGPILMIATGFLLNTKALDVTAVYLVFVSADLLADVGWYGIGRYFAGPILEQHGTFLGISEKKYQMAIRLFQKYHEKLLMISKLTIGFGLAIVTLMVAGASRVPFRSFLVINIIGEFFLVAGLLGIGYWFGQIFIALTGPARYVFLICAVIAAFLVTYGFSKYVNRQMTQDDIAYHSDKK